MKIHGIEVAFDGSYADPTSPWQNCVCKKCGWSKIITMTVIMSGLMLLFYFGGLITTETDDGTCEGQSPNSILLNILMLRFESG